MKYPFLLALLMEVASLAGHATAVPYGVAKEPWDARFGNHRARIRVDKKADAVRVHLPWRRRDPRPEEKEVWIIDARTGKRVRNVVRVEVNREFADLVFQAAAAGEYHAYTAPFTVRGRSFPTTVYDKPAPTADEAWLERHGLDGAKPDGGKWRSLPAAEVVAFEARRPFDRMDPMEVIATAAEVEKLLAHHPGACLLFPEDRRFPIRMASDVPQRWIERGPGGMFRGEARRNEFYVFQVGVYAARAEIGDLAVRFSELRPAGQGRPILAAALRCFNTGGRDWLGRPMKKTVAVAKGRVQALWIGVDVPADAMADTYEGTVTIQPVGQEPKAVKLVLKVSSEILEDRGDGELGRLSRLRWLDSTAGLEDEVTAPYTPLAVDGSTVACLGRDVTFGPGGLPGSIRAGNQELLARPVALVVATEQGPVKFQFDGPRLVKSSPATVVLESTGQGGPFTLSCRAKMEFDGYVNFQLALESENDTDLTDCRLEIPLREAFATYMMGMGRKGGYRPERWEWKWDPARHQDSVWIGAVTGGLQCKLKGPDYRWPLVNIHYHRRPLLMPEAWHNGGKGGCVIERSGGGAVLLSAYGGPRRLVAGKPLRFDFGLLVTPVKPLDIKAHWTHRYYHGGVPSPADVAKTKARIVNIHHGNPLNPFINYPFLTTGKLAAYAQSVHQQGLKFKLYYTIRELSNHVVELWALRSLGGEIYADGPGGGYAWLHEHLVDGYSPAWHHPFADGTWCASISQTGLSRWHNYYIEGLGWLARNVKIDGLYLDEIGYDREIMKRVRRVLDKNRPGSLLDLHSWNHFNGRAGYANCLNLYLEHMPYLDSLWIGEGRDYDEPPDHWMVEISGIPFGLFSEMLQNGGNPWRGMLYGMTNRLPWSGNPQPIWKLWDEFGIQEAEMLGYWSPGCPVKTGRDNVLATVYRRKGKALVCLASWEKETVNCTLQIDWKALGLDPARARCFAPAIDRLQEQRGFHPTDPIPVEPRKGWVLVLEETPPSTSGPLTYRKMLVAFCCSPLRAEPEAKAGQSLWELARAKQQVHRFSTLFTAQQVRDHLSTDRGIDTAVDWCRKTAVTKVYVESFRSSYLAPRETLRRAKERFQAAGFEVSGCVTTTIVGKKSTGWKLISCYTDRATQDKLQEIFEYTAGIFDEIMIDDFWFTDCKCKECDAARRAKKVTIGQETYPVASDTWEDYRCELMVRLSRERILAPARRVNPNVKVIIKYPQWYDRFHERGYEVLRETADFDRIWVGTETRDYDDARWGGTPQYEAYFLMRWLGGIGGPKCGGGWFDPYGTTEHTYVEQARQTVLAGARESLLFCYGSLLEHTGPKNVEALRKCIPELLAVAGEVRRRKVVGIAAYKPPGSHPENEPRVFDFAGMMGLPLVPCHEFPTRAKAAFFSVHALKDPGLVARLSAFIASGRPVLVTDGLAGRLAGKLKLDAPNVHRLPVGGDPKSLLKMPQPKLDALRKPLLGPLGHAFRAPNRVALYLLDDGSWVIENFHDKAVTVELDGAAREVPPRGWLTHWK